MKIFGTSKSFSRSTSNRRNATSISGPKVLLHRDNSIGFRRDSWDVRKFCIFVLIGSLIFYLGASFWYLCVSPNLGLAPKELIASPMICDVFDGNWVLDYSYPLYNSSECPFVEQGFNCLDNGRKDKGYLRWRWKPKYCDIPRFNASNILDKLQGKRIVFVGDSMSRTQWESFICLLMTGVEDKRSVYMVNGKKITKTTRHLVAHFRTFNLFVEFYRSVFLVQTGIVPKHSPKRVKSTLKLDKLDFISKEWVDSDALIFNSGHWWIPSKLYDTGCYFQLGGSLKLGTSIASAYKIAMSTWASWVKTSVNSTRTHVFFRTFEPSHWSNQSIAHCTAMQYPEPASRGDAHVGNWSDRKFFTDCSHWCLPGVPDFWNEILLSRLFSHNKD